MTQKINYSDTTPAADANSQLLKWKADAPSSDPTITRNVSVETPLLTASGTGHQAGIAPDPGGAAGTTKFLREDASWQVPAGGGGGTGYVLAGPPDAPPQTPNAMDDEFAAASLNAKWTRLQSGAITDSYSLGRLILTAVTGGSFLITQAKPASPCEFTACFTIDTNNTTASGNNPGIGLMFGDGTKLVTLIFGFINTTWHFEIENWTNSTTFSSTPVSVANPWGPTGSGLGYMPKLYLRIKDDGTSFLCSVSNDGINFTQIGSVLRTAFMTTPSTVGIFSIGSTGGTGGFTCDWFRRTDGGYTPAAVSSADVIPGAMVVPPAPASFSWVNQGTGSLATTGSKGALFMSSGIVASTPNVKLATQALPATPYQFVVGILPQVPSNGSNHPQCGIALYDSVSGKLTNLGFDPQAGGIELDKWTSTSVFSATYAITRAVLYQHFFRSIVWLKLADDGTNRTYSVSSDGINWLVIFSVGRTDFLTPNQAALYVQPDQLVFASAMTVMSYYLGV